MIQNPKVSICIPVYNGEKYLVQCLDSVLSQSYFNIEIIIIDDCSNDNSVTIIEQYISNNPSIRFVRNESNIGLTANWNKCIHYSTGEWIKFIFQDDFLEESCIDTFVEYIRQNNGDCPLLVSKRRFLTDPSMSSNEQQYYSNDLPTLSRIDIAIENDYISSDEISNAAVKYMAMNFIGEPTVIMFRKNVTLDIGIFNESLEQICDLEFVLRIGSIFGLIYIPHELTFFRIHEHSTTSKNISEKYYRLSNLEPIKLAHLMMFDKLYEYLRRSLTSFNKFKLKNYFLVRGHEAWINASASPENMMDFNMAASAFPNLEQLKTPSSKNSFFLKLVKLKRLVMKIAGR